jgi:hypothetical protein
MNKFKILFLFYLIGMVSIASCQKTETNDLTKNDFIGTYTEINGDKTLTITAGDTPNTVNLSGAYNYSNVSINSSSDYNNYSCCSSNYCNHSQTGNCFYFGTCRAQFVNNQLEISVKNNSNWSNYCYFRRK